MTSLLAPGILGRLLDELGYLPIDKTGADLLLQIISQSTGTFVKYFQTTLLSPDLNRFFNI